METKEFVPLLTGPHSETCVSPHLYRKALHRPGSLQSLSVQVGADSHRTALVMSPKPWATLWTPACKLMSKVDWRFYLMPKMMLSTGGILWRLHYSRNNNSETISELFADYLKGSKFPFLVFRELKALGSFAILSRDFAFIPRCRAPPRPAAHALCTSRYCLLIIFTLVPSLTWRSQLVVSFLFLTSSLRVTIVRALPTKPNRHSTEMSTTSIDSWNAWKASMAVAWCQPVAGGQGISESSHVKLNVALVSNWKIGVNGGYIRPTLISAPYQYPLIHGSPVSSSLFTPPGHR